MVYFSTLAQKASPVLMGIMNITPDSFSDGGDLNHQNKTHEYINDLINLNVNIIDIGAESTRPNSIKIDAETEIKRLSTLKLPLRHTQNTFFSIDTYKAKTAEFALKNGFNVVNDVMGLQFDADMAKVIADHNASVIIMYNHSLTKNHSGNIITDAMTGLQKSLDIALKHNIAPNKICLDIGIGFGVKYEQNIALINHIPHFKTLGFAIMVGASRKSFIGHYLNIADPKQRLSGTLATHYHAVKQGADILRVHDVTAHQQFFKMLDICQHTHHKEQ